MTALNNQAGYDRNEADKKEKDQCKIDLSNLVRGQFLCKLNGHVYVSTPPEL